MTDPLHLKYRPQNFDDMVGNETMLDTLKRMITREEGLPQTYLLKGPSGCGKTTLSRIMANYFVVNKLDIYEYNISSLRGIDQARNIIEQVSVSGFGSAGKVIILNECHAATKDFQNAMLEVLEEPPPGVFFILCTTDPNKLLKTVRNRCQTFSVGYLTRKSATKLIKTVCDSENIPYDRQTMGAIIGASDGSPRSILVALDSIKDTEDAQEMLDTLKDLNVNEDDLADLCKGLLRKDGWKKISKVLKSLQGDPEGVRLRTLGWMNKILLAEGGSRPFEIIDEFSEPFYSDALLTRACYVLSINDEDI